MAPARLRGLVAAALFVAFDLLTAVNPTCAVPTTVGTTTIDTKVLWSLAGSPYTVMGTVSISLLGSLTIQQGVLVRLDREGEIFGSPPH